MTNYSISKTLNTSFEEAIQLTKDALKQEGFGVLTEIDIQAKMKEKLGKDMSPYIILGACHPPSAYEAIQMEQEIGLMLPCNVILYENNGTIIVSAIKPTIAMSSIDNEGLNELAQRVEKSLERVINSI